MRANGAGEAQEADEARPRAVGFRDAADEADGSLQSIGEEQEIGGAELEIQLLVRLVEEPRMGSGRRVLLFFFVCLFRQDRDGFVFPFGLEQRGRTGIARLRREGRAGSEANQMGQRLVGPTE